MYTKETFVDSTTVNVVYKTKNGKSLPVSITRKFYDKDWLVQVTIPMPKYAKADHLFYFYKKHVDQVPSIKNVFEIMKIASEAMQAKCYPEWVIYNKEKQKRKLEILEKHI